MHEEPYAQAMLDMALEGSGGRPVRRILLGVGRFSAIVPSSLEVFFRYLCKGTPAEDAVLVFETVPVVLTCKTCGTDRVLDIPLEVPVQPALAAALREPCRCGETGYSVTGGLTMEMISMDVEADPAAP